MQDTLTVAMAQLNFMLGDIQGNCEKIIASAFQARDTLHADVVVFPELSITGYPPEDLLLRPQLHRHVMRALEMIREQVTGIHVVVGHPHVTGAGLFNAASVFYNHKQIAHYRKQHLPNYSVFDEKRYFLPGTESCVFSIKKTKLAITICEDLWQSGPLKDAARAEADLVLSLNASPFHSTKYESRIEKLQARQQTEAALPIFYVNAVGGQDELVFDGGSMVLDANGQLMYSAPRFQESLDAVRVNLQTPCQIEPTACAPSLDSLAAIYQALTLGTKDYLEKNRFKGALIGLSGGIDSALTCAVAADAIGPKNIHAVLMPSRYTAQMSIDDAIAEAELLGVKHSTLSIEPTFQAFLEQLNDEFAGLPVDTTEENIQARCRGTLLMALSNKSGKLVLTTGNKSELAVGYSTLYGDMAGGFNVLKDVPKTLVYQLANYRNQLRPVIPQRVIDRAPSAELRESQVDQDSLPAYEILDQILEQYVTHNKSAEEIIAQGIDVTAVKQVIRLIDINEYKRRQSAPGVRISRRAFGRDWRFPITSAFGRQA